MTLRKHILVVFHRVGRIFLAPEHQAGVSLWAGQPGFSQTHKPQHWRETRRHSEDRQRSEVNPPSSIRRVVVGSTVKEFLLNHSNSIFKYTHTKMNNPCFFFCCCSWASSILMLENLNKTKKSYSFTFAPKLETPSIHVPLKSLWMSRYYRNIRMTSATWIHPET